MMADYSSFQVGNVVYPVPISPLVGARAALDPALNDVLAFYVAMIQGKLGAYFDALVTSISMPDLVGKIVAESVGYDPTPYMKAGTYKFPLLAIYRTEDETSEHTVAWYKNASSWTVLYVLPTLTAAQASQLTHVLKAVKAVITDRTIQGYDETYLSKKEVLKDAGIMSVSIGKARYGSIPELKTDLVFPALELSLVVDEREETSPGLEDFTRLDTEIAVSNGTPAEDLTVVETWEVMT